MKKLYADFARFKPLHGRTYFPLPQELLRRKAIINVQNDDEQCLKWALLSALHPMESHSGRVTKYQPYEHELDFSGIDFPATLLDINQVRLPSCGHFLLFNYLHF